MNIQPVLASVSFQGSIIDRCGQTVRKFAPQKNLILDVGLDIIATKQWVAAMQYFGLGTGNTPTNRDSGAVTVSIAGGVATASAGFFEVQDVGRLLKLDSGPEYYVTGYTSPTQLTLAGSVDVGATQFTIWYVNQTGLTAEVQRFNTDSPDSGDAGKSWNAGTGVLSTWTTRIGRFEPAPITYKEIGWFTNGAGTIFGRAVLAGGGVSLAAGQAYKVKVQLDRVLSPRTPQAVGAIVAGWPTGTGYQSIERIGLRYWESGGSEGGNWGSEPSSGNSRVLLSSTAAPLDAPSIAGGGGLSILAWKPSALGGYTPGSCKRSISVTFGLLDANSGSIRSIALADGYGISDFRWLLDSNQSKNSSQTLTLNIERSWGRVLVN